MPPFSKTDPATKEKLFNAVINELCARKPQDYASFTNTAMRAALEKHYNEFVEGNLFHATTHPKVLEELYDFVMNSQSPQLVKNRGFPPYLAGIKTWKDEPPAEPEHPASAGAGGAGGDFTQAGADYAEAEEEEAEYAAEREAVAAAQKKAHAQAEKLKQQAQEAKEAEDELKKQQAALKKKQDEAAARKAEAAQAVLDAAKARAQEQQQQQQQQQPPSAKKSKTPFTDFYGTLKPEQQKELYEAGVCDDKGKFSKKQTLNKATREEFKVSQLNMLAELDAIVKNW
jgi:chemotaxis protein histidine kinase CheA